MAARTAAGISSPDELALFGIAASEEGVVAGGAVATPDGVAAGRAVATDEGAAAQGVVAVPADDGADDSSNDDG